MAELHVFECGCTTFSTFEKTGFKCWRLLCWNSWVELENHVFDHETRTSGLCSCYRLKTNAFLSSCKENLKIDIFTSLQQMPCYCKSRLGTLRLISWWGVTYVADTDVYTDDKLSLGSRTFCQKEKCWPIYEWQDTSHICCRQIWSLFFASESYLVASTNGVIISMVVGKS